MTLEQYMERRKRELDIFETAMRHYQKNELIGDDLCGADWREQEQAFIEDGADDYDATSD